jgi:hypothetical protein
LTSDQLVLVAVVVAVVAVSIGAIFVMFRRNDPQRAISNRWKKQEKERAKAEAEAAKQKLKEEKALADIKKNADAPPANPPPESTPVSALEEEIIGEFLPIEIGKEKKGKRVTVFSGRIRVRPDRFGRLRDKFLFQWDRGGYFVSLNKVIEVEVKAGRFRTHIEKVRKLVYDVIYAEPLKADGTVEWSTELEEILTDEGAGQYITAATTEGGFQLTPALVRAVVVIGVLCGFLGLAINGSLHVVPTTIIRWVP